MAKKAKRRISYGKMGTICLAVKGDKQVQPYTIIYHDSADYRRYRNAVKSGKLEVVELNVEKLDY